jgi:hypothetical protein
MENPVRAVDKKNRRSFLKQSVVGVGAVGVGVSLLPTDLSAQNGPEKPTKGDIAILTFLSALEQVEADLWIQYAELGGATNQGLSPIELSQDGHKISTGLAPEYVQGLQVLDTDMPQYVADNTDDEISHHSFLNNYLMSKGAPPVDLNPQFAILPHSDVPGVAQTKRLTNLRNLTVDTSWWTRYRSVTDPDFGGGPFENAVPDLAKGQFPAIPFQADLGSGLTNHLQAIANTAGFHFAFIEQGGTSLYPTLAQQVSNLEVLRVLLSIGGSEIMHFQVWHDKAGNAKALTDGALTFPVLDGSNDPNGILSNPNAIADTFQANLIMPEPTTFLDPNFGPVAIIRPTSSKLNGAVAAVTGFVDDGLFLDPSTPGKNSPIVGELMKLAEAADAARRT